MTYSIVARDPVTGELGVAVQSHYFSVGSVVPWTEAGVGAVATQASAELSYGPLGLELMRAGKSAPDALRELVAADADASRRQVAMVDAKGNTAVHTGEICIAYAGHRTGNGVTVEANMMERDTVPDAMLAAYESTTGPLAERLLAALDAAEAEGGDIRGKQSAAMSISSGPRQDKPWKGDKLDLRVEDHPDPLVELRRLVQVQRAYRLADAAEKAGTAGDIPEAIAKMMEAMQLSPGNPEISFWAAMGAAMSGQMPMAKQLLAQAVAVDPRWADLVGRLPPTGMFPLSDEAVRELTGG
jgi:uncharacterized Ntn-hydrolase superfamily protein